MAKVPRFQRRTGAPTPVRETIGVRATPADFGAQEAEALGQVGRSLQIAGEAAERRQAQKEAAAQKLLDEEFARMEKERAKQASLEAQQADSTMAATLRRRLHTDDDAYYRKQGLDAVNAQEQIADEYDKITNETAKDLAPDAREVFDRANVRRRQALLDDYARFSQRQSDAAQQTTRADVVAQSIADGAASPGSASAQEAKLRGEDAIRGTPGVSEETRQRRMENFRTQFHQQALDTLMNTGALGAAQNYFDTNKDEIDPTVRDNLQVQLRNQVDLANAQTTADEALAKHPVESSAETLAQMNAALDEAADKYEGRQRALVEEQIKAKYASVGRLRTEQEREQLNANIVAMQSAGTRSRALGIANQAGLPADSRVKLRNYADSLYPPPTPDAVAAAAKPSPGQAAASMTEIRRNIDLGVLTGSEDVIALGAGQNLSQAQLDELVDYHRNGGNKNLVKQRDVESAMALIEETAIKSLDEEEVDAMWAHVREVLPPDTIPNPASVRDIVARAMREGDVITRNRRGEEIDREGSTFLEAYDRNLSAQWLPDIDDQEAAGLRAQLMAQGIDPQPEGEADELDVERAFSRVSDLGLPALGAGLRQQQEQQRIGGFASLEVFREQQAANRQAELTDTAIRNATDRAEVRLPSGGIIYGEPALRAQANAAASQGVTPTWMLPALSAMGEQKRYFDSMPVDPGERAQYIRAVANGLLEQ